MQIEILKQKSIFSLLLYGTRPKTLTASAFPVILGMLLARNCGYYSISVYLCTLFSGIFLQIGANLANDYFDGKNGRDTKKRLGPLRLGSSNLISKKTLLLSTIFSFTIAALFAIPLVQKGGNIIIFLTLLGVFLGFYYSVGKYSLANTGLSNFVIFTVFGPLSTLMTYYLQTGIYKTEVAFIGIIPGCLSLMLFAMNNLRDIEEDRSNGKNTLVVRFGFDWGKREYLISLFTSWLIIPMCLMIYNTPIITLLPLILIPKGVKIGKKILNAKSAKDITVLFEETAKYNLLYALFTIISWRIASL
jgi:1,4-dihydroxy-2-naphthoate octaprenyltransferase